MKSQSSPSQQRTDAGIVSIMVTLVLMIVITLIVLGFAALSRREQRQSLDRQLSTQAFLAAESGVNEARDAIFDKLKNNQPIDAKPDCETGPMSPPMYNFDPVIDAANNVEYTCLLIDKDLEDITQPIGADGKSVTIPLNPVGGKIETLNIKWNLATSPSASQLANCAASVTPGSSFNPATGAGAWTCPYGVLRIDLVRTDAGALNRNALNQNQKATFLYPTKAGVVADLPYPSAKGAVAPMACTVNGCSINITGIPPNGPSEFNWAMRLSSVYAGGTFVISAQDASNATLQLDDAQVQVDVTGKAQDVLRRMRVRFSIIPGSSANNGEYAIQSAGPLCKRFNVTRPTNTFSVPGDIEDQGALDTNPMCVAATENPPIPPNTVITANACVRQPANLVKYPNFEEPAGPGPGTAATAGFTSDIPNRGPNVYPDDEGVADGALPIFSGGYSIQTGPKVYEGGYLRMRPFAGDPALQVPGANTYWYSNPNQRTSDPPGFTRDWEGILYETQITGLKQNQLYDFSAYFANWIPITNTDPNWEFFPEDPWIEMSVDGLVVRPRERVEMVPTDAANDQLWQRVGFVFSTGPGQTAVTLQIADYAANINGDDFAMTGVGLYECTGLAPTPPPATPTPPTPTPTPTTPPLDADLSYGPPAPPPPPGQDPPVPPQACWERKGWYDPECWLAGVYNDSDNAPGTLSRCEFNWGDGVVQSFNGSSNECAKGNWVNHQYTPQGTQPVPTVFTVTLTNYSTQGQKFDSNSIQYWRPW